MPPLVDPSTFRAACGRFATGITVATVAGADGKPQGMTANSFVSISLEPPLVAVCVEREASIHEHFTVAKAFGISILDETQRSVSDRFAYGAGDRFEGIGWTAGPLGSPLLEGTLVQLDCAIVQQVAAGDHTLFIGEVRHAVAADEGRPLLYFASAYRRMHEH
jgi:flavin reductase (DIM6/NTAB) family NADH-FMN oxidoreductase RutF